MRVSILSSVHNALDNRIFYREALSLRRAGYEVVLIANHLRDEEKEGIRIFALPRVSRWKRPLVWLKLLRRALASKADVFIFHDPELLLVMPLLRLFSGKPTVYDIHESYEDFIKVKEYIPAVLRYPLTWLFKAFESMSVRFQSALIFADDHIAEDFRNVKCPKATLFNFPARSFVEEAELMRRKQNVRQPVILHLGVHERGRGVLVIIDAFSRVLEVVPEARLFLVGPFTMREFEQEVREHIRRKGIEQAVVITGHVRFESIGEYLRQAAVGWIALQPVDKYQKNIPTKLFEYMSYEVPIVSSDLESVSPFIKDDLNGYLVVPEDPEDHARAIVRILKNPSKAAAMGRCGREMVINCYNWDEMEGRLLGLFDELKQRAPVMRADKG